MRISFPIIMFNFLLLFGDIICMLFDNLETRFMKIITSLLLYHFKFDDFNITLHATLILYITFMSYFTLITTCLYSPTIIYIIGWLY